MSSRSRSVGRKSRQTRTSTGALQRPNYSLKSSFSELDNVVKASQNAPKFVEQDAETDDNRAAALIDELNAQTTSSITAKLKSQVKSGKFGGVHIFYNGKDGNLKCLKVQDVSAAILGSRVFGAYLRSEPNAIIQLEAAKVEFSDACQKFNVAIRAAKKDIFRIQELPIELRLMIWKFMSRTPKKFRAVAWDTAKLYEFPALIDGFPALNMMLASKWIYQEVKPVFYQQATFILTAIIPNHPIWSTIKECVRNVSYTWTDSYVRDARCLPLLAGLKHLEEFELVLTTFVFSNRIRRNRNKLHQSEPACQKFKAAHGFDALFKLKVSELSLVKCGQDPPIDVTITDNEIARFGDFLFSEIKVSAGEPLPTPAKVEEVEDGDLSDGEYGKRPTKRARTNKGASRHSTN